VEPRLGSDPARSTFPGALAADEHRVT
jgi:hypothetical protein